MFTRQLGQSFPETIYWTTPGTSLNALGEISQSAPESNGLSGTNASCVTHGRQTPGTGRMSIGAPHLPQTTYPAPHTTNAPTPTARLRPLLLSHSSPFPTTSLSPVTAPDADLGMVSTFGQRRNPRTLQCRCSELLLRTKYLRTSFTVLTAAPPLPALRR